MIPNVNMGYVGFGLCLLTYYLLKVLCNHINLVDTKAKLSLTYSLAHILSFTFWGTIKSRGLDWAVASEPGLPGSCEGREEAVITLDISVVESDWAEEANDCPRFLDEAGKVEGIGSAIEGNTLRAAEVTGKTPVCRAALPTLAPIYPDLHSFGNASRY